MSILFLDDSLKRCKRLLQDYPYAVTVQTAEDAIKRLQEGGSWVTVSLDHDLGEEVYVHSDRPDCGMEVVRWVEVNHPDVGDFIIHSLNFPAAQAMVGRLRDAGYRTQYQPFGITWCKPWEANE